MKNKIKIISAVMIVTVIFAGVSLLRSEETQNQTDIPLPVEKVTIETKSGQKHVFNLEVAVKPEDLEKGLMHRASMKKDDGMLFFFGEEPRMVSFWMKDTVIPLDMLFVDEEGIIASIHANAEPGSLESISSVYPVVTVVEINGGEAAHRNIKPGDYVKLPDINEELSH